MASGQTTTVNPEEIAQFDAIATEWWDERGKFAPLHRMNPTRLVFIRQQIEQHFGRPVGDHAAHKPLAPLRMLDVGCGGGLICEPLARLGAAVTGIDAGAENIAIARAHAEGQGLSIDYRPIAAEALAETGAQYDVVLALEIVEHVADVALFFTTLAQLVKPGGLLLLSTLNRTARSYALAIVGAEYILRWLPRGTHDWNKFLKPSEMAEYLGQHRLDLVALSGLTYRPLSARFGLNPRDLSVNYLLAAKKPA